MNKIQIIGIGFRPLDKKACGVLLESDVVLTNNRLLDVFMQYKEYEAVKDRIIIHGTVYEMIEYIGEHYRDRKIALLAAGDPMFFGIGRLVIERFGQDAAEIYPDLSSVQVAFSRARETANNALLISLHGGPDPAKRRKLEYEIAELPALLIRHNKLAVLTDKTNGPVEIARELMKSSLFSAKLSKLKIYVCEKLGYDNEKITEGGPEEIAGKSFEHPNVVIVKSQIHVGAIHELPLHVFGLKEDEIKHSKGLITKDEVRAVAIHKLRLLPKGVLWDIGAGSGSVSIEAARLCPGLKVFAVERNEKQLVHINDNKNKFEVANIEIVEGEAPTMLKELPAPDRVFIGGSGGNMEEIVKTAGGRMSSGIIVINATTIETLNEAMQSLEKEKFSVDVCEVLISRSKKIGQKRHLKALNPIFVVTGEK